MNPEEEELKPPVITEPTKTVDSEVINSVLSSWNGDVGRYKEVVSVVGGVFGLFRTVNGGITNQENIEAQIMDGIASSGRNNPNYKDILGKLASPVEQTVRKQYEEMGNLGDSEGQSAILSNEINTVLRNYNLTGYADVLAPDVRVVVLEKLGKDAEVPKPVTEKTSQPVQQQEDEKEKDEKDEKEDSKSKKEEKETEEEKDPNKRLDPEKSEFERDIRESREKKGESEKGEETGEENPHDPDDVKHRNQNKQKESDQGNNAEPQEASTDGQSDNSSKSKLNQEKPAEDSSEASSQQPGQGGGDGKSSTSTKDNSGEKPGGKNETNSGQPDQSSQGSSGNEIANQGNKPPGNSSLNGNKPGNTGTPSSEIPSPSKLPSENLAPGRGGIKRLSSDPLSGAKPSFPSDGPLKIPKIKPLDGGTLNKIPGKGSINLGKSFKDFNKLKAVGSNPVEAGKQIAKDAASEAAKKAAQQAAKATAKLASQAAQAGLRLAGSAIQAIVAFLAPLAPVIAIIAIIVALILGILFIITAFACPGINTFAAKSSEIVGADKLAFNDKLDERCRSENKNPCGPGSGNVSNTDFGSGDGKITARECAKAKELWPLFQKAGAEFGVDPYILAGIAQRESNMTFGLSPSGTCAGKGDSGFGHGLMQIDSGSHQAYLSEGTWTDCQDNINYAASLFKSIQTRWPDVGLRQQLNAYNAGSPCKSGTDSCTTKSYGTGTLVDIANVKNCLTGINLPTPSQNTGRLDNANSQNFFAFNPFGSVEVRAASDLAFDSWLPPGNSFNIDRDSDFRNTKQFVVLDSSGGIDFTLAPPGKSYEQSRNTPIVSHLQGEVTYIDNPGPQYEAGSYGNLVAVYYPSINRTITYAHLETVDVKPGDSVSPGTLLGRQGSSGSSPGDYVHVDLRVFEGKISNGGVLAVGRNGSIEYTQSFESARAEYSKVFSDILLYYNANSDKIASSNFSPTATLASSTSSSSSSSSNPCPTTGSISSAVGVGSATLLEEARRRATGKPALGRCYDSVVGVASYINNVGFAGIKPGEFLTQPMVGDQGCAVGFAEHYNYNNGEFARKQGIVNLLDANPNLSPYNAPAGSIVVVTAGSPGTAHPYCGDIAVADGAGKFYNDGEMSYGGPELWNGSKAGSGRVLGIYVPATGVNALPKQTV